MLGLDENPLAKHIPVEIHRLDSWVIRETVAENCIPDKKVFLLGDAAQRHPPAYGLGSNTCVQDAYNLAWKAAYVSQGLAGSGFLETYNVERQPVGAQLVREANAELLQYLEVRAALGGLSGSHEDRSGIHGLLTDSTPAGEDYRGKMHEAFEAKMGEGLSLGLFMNQLYEFSAVYLDEELEPRLIPQGFNLIANLNLGGCGLP